MTKTQQKSNGSNKDLSSQSYGFSSSHVWMNVSWDYKESWVLKNGCFSTAVLEKTLESPLVYSLEGLMVKLKLQYFGHLMQRADSMEKTPMMEKIEGKRRGQQKMRC